jgi:antitoxin CcdA
MRIHYAHMKRGLREAGAAYRSGATRKATNVTVDADVLKQARALGINLSAVLESRLVELIREAEREGWRTANREAIESYNARIERDGVFGDRYRRF